MLTAPADCCCASGAQCPAQLPPPANSSGALLRPITGRGPALHWRLSGPATTRYRDTLHLELYNNYLPQNRFLSTVLKPNMLSFKFKTILNYMVVVHSTDLLCLVLALQSAELGMGGGCCKGRRNRKRTDNSSETLPLCFL